MQRKSSSKTEIEALLLFAVKFYSNSFLICVHTNWFVCSILSEFRIDFYLISAEIKTAETEHFAVIIFNRRGNHTIWLQIIMFFFVFPFFLLRNRFSFSYFTSVFSMRNQFVSGLYFDGKYFMTNMFRVARSLAIYYERCVAYAVFYK